MRQVYALYGRTAVAAEMIDTLWLFAFCLSFSVLKADVSVASRAYGAGAFAPRETL